MPQAEPPRVWHVDAHVGWKRPDSGSVARALAEGVAAQPAADAVSGTATDFGFAVRFQVMATSRLDADAAASRTERAAWAATGIEVTKEDLSVTSISLR